MKAVPKLRSPLDRLRQVMAFEIGGLILVTPPFAWASGVPARDSIGLLVLIAAIAALWNAAYTTAFDYLEGRLTGRPADRRTTFWRVVQAFGFEIGLLLMSLPIVMAWTKMGWLEALLIDLGLALAYVAYAYVFNLAYDRTFPIVQAGSSDPAKLPS
jgi:uncharacterized membrane protein